MGQRASTIAEVRDDVWVDVAVDRPNPGFDLRHEVQHSAASKGQTATKLSPTSLSHCASHPASGLIDRDTPMMNRARSIFHLRLGPGSPRGLSA